MSMLLAISGNKHDPSLGAVRLNRSMQEAVLDVFQRQERAFRKYAEEIPYDPNWKGDRDSIMVCKVPESVKVFDQISELTDRTAERVPVRMEREAVESTLGLAVRIDDGRNERILVQSINRGQQLTQPGVLTLVMTMRERGTFTRLTSSGFRLDEKLLCIVEGGRIKFKSLHNLGRIIDTSTIFSEATEQDVKSFARDHSHIFDIDDIDYFVTHTSRNARKYLASVIESGVLQNHTPSSLQRATAGTKLTIQVSPTNGKIMMPVSSREITELIRFLNDGRYQGPVSGQAFITNSWRTVS